MLRGPRGRIDDAPVFGKGWGDEKGIVMVSVLVH